MGRDATVPVPYPVKYGAKRYSIYEFHCVEDFSIRVHAKIMDRHDVRMFQLPHYLRFLDEAQQIPVHSENLLLEHFHRDAAAELLVPCLEDDPHPTFSHLAAHLVFPTMRIGEQRQRRSYLCMPRKTESFSVGTVLRQIHHVAIGILSGCKCFRAHLNSPP